MANSFSILGDSGVGSKGPVLFGGVSGVTLSTPFPLNWPGTSVVAKFPAPCAGSLYAISGTQQAATIQSATFRFAAAINGVQTALITPAISFNGTQQDHSVIAPMTITFNAGDELTIIGIPSAAVTLGFSATAVLMAII